MEMERIKHVFYEVKMNIPKKIERLKKQAREYYLSYQSVLNEHDCGANLAEELFADLSGYKHKFNETMDALALIDSSTPTARL